MRRWFNIAVIPALLLVALVFPQTRDLILGAATSGGIEASSSPESHKAARRPLRAKNLRQSGRAVVSASAKRVERTKSRPAPRIQRASPELASAARLRELHAQQRKRVWLQIKGRVVKVLPDDNEGHRHQRFLVAVARDVTLLIAHNIDLAKRAPIARGAHVHIRGRYEANSRGGVVHWTHHDPNGRRRGGWIDVGGERTE